MRGMVVGEGGRSSGVLLYPQKYSENFATYNFACLHFTTQSDFWGNVEDGHMETLKKNRVRTFQNIMKWPKRAYRNKLFLYMKEYSALHKYFNTINYTL